MNTYPYFSWIVHKIDKSSRWGTQKSINFQTSQDFHPVFVFTLLPNHAFVSPISSLFIFSSLSASLPFLLPLFLFSPWLSVRSPRTPKLPKVDRRPLGQSELSTALTEAGSSRTAANTAFSAQPRPFVSLPSSLLARAASSAAFTCPWSRLAPTASSVEVDHYTTRRFYAKSRRKMPPKKQAQEEKIPLGRPGNNLKSGIV